VDVSACRRSHIANDFNGILVIAQRDEAAVAQVTSADPFYECDLTNQLGVSPSGTPSSFQQ